MHCTMKRKIILATYLPIRGDVWRMVSDSWMRGWTNSSVSPTSWAMVPTVQSVLRVVDFKFPHLSAWQSSKEVRIHSSWFKKMWLIFVNGNYLKTNI